jgi:hypothetical protein
MDRDALVVAAHQPRVGGRLMLRPAYTSAGNSVASGPMNSSERSRTGLARATASNLSALYMRNQTRRRRSASIGSGVRQYASVLLPAGTY